MMPPPILTAEQRVVAGEKAVAARKSRAEVRRRLAAGETSLADVIDMAQTDKAIGRMRVSVVLQSIRGIGKARAQQVMERCEISPARRLRGLGRRQTGALVQVMQESQTDHT